MQAPFGFYRFVIRDRQYDEVLGVAPKVSPRRLHRLLRKLLWFWPRIDEARGWAAADTGIAWAPENYLHTHRTRLVEKINEIVPKDASMIELGCNCGSDMHILHMDGYSQISGMDAGGRALDLFARSYPETYAMAQPRHDLFQRFLLSTPTGACDYLYSNGATIELAHPSFPMVKEICRVTRRGVLLDLSERHQGYPRDYQRQFAKQGFSMVFNDETEAETHQSSLVVFLRDD